MRCPACDFSDSKVLESRAIEYGAVIRRRRACAQCSTRFTTYERIEAIPLVVIKCNGNRELFSQEKLLRGLQFATQKRPIKFAQLEELAIETENYMLNKGHPYEVTSKEIGEFVVEKLKELDEIAYIRFISVYHQFTDINSFVKEITKLKNENG